MLNIVHLSFLSKSREKEIDLKSKIEFGMKELEIFWLSSRFHLFYFKQLLEKKWELGDFCQKKNQNYLNYLNPISNEICLKANTSGALVELRFSRICSKLSHIWNDETLFVFSFDVLNFYQFGLWHFLVSLLFERGEWQRGIITYC